MTPRDLAIRLADTHVHWTEHAAERLKQRGGKIGRREATAEIRAALEAGRTSTTIPVELGIGDNPTAIPQTFYAWSIDKNRIYALAEKANEVAVITVLRPTFAGRLRALKTRPLASVRSGQEQEGTAP